MDTVLVVSRILPYASDISIGGLDMAHLNVPRCHVLSCHLYEFILGSMWVAYSRWGWVSSEDIPGRHVARRSLARRSFRPVAIIPSTQEGRKVLRYAVEADLMMS